MWNGWFSVDGVEVINSQRVERYAQGSGWFRPVYRNDEIGLLLGETYTSPLVDSPPWVDPDSQDSYGFYGVYPLTITGGEDSTRTSSVTESVLDGGVPGRIRHATRTLVFNCLLLGSSDAAVDAGMRWLKSVLLGGLCNPNYASVCNGGALCYFNAEPTFDETAGADECYDLFARTLNRVVFNSGPTVLDKKVLSDGSSVWNVQFSAVAGIPWEFGAGVDIAEGIFDPAVANPVLVDTTFDFAGHTFMDANCPVPFYTPVFDPECPMLIPPPPPPDVALGCFTPPTSWTRRQLVIPEDLITVWSDVVPVLTVKAVINEVRNLRVRWYPDPSGNGDPDADPCSFCGDMLISYVPVGGELVINGIDRSITYVDGVTARRADSLVFASDGSPFAWPSLTCGYSYILTIDALQTYNPEGDHVPGPVLPYLDLILYPRAA